MLDCIDTSGEEVLSLGDKFSPRPLVSLSNPVAKAAMDGSMLVSLGLVCALCWVEVFESDCMTRNDSEDSLWILGLILEELDEGLSVLLSSIKFRRTRKKCNFLDLDPLRVRKQNRRQALCYVCTGFS